MGHSHQNLTESSCYSELLVLGIPWHLYQSIFDFQGQITSRISPPAKIFITFFASPLSIQDHFFSGSHNFQHQLFSLEPHLPSFLSLNSLCAETQWVISLLIHVSLSWLSINWQILDMPLLPGPDVIKIYSKTTQLLQLTSCRLMLGRLKSVSNDHPHPQLPLFKPFFFFPSLRVTVRIS